MKFDFSECKKRKFLKFTLSVLIILSLFTKSYSLIPGMTFNVNKK